MRVDIPSTRGISWWSSPHQRWCPEAPAVEILVMHPMLFHWWMGISGGTVPYFRPYPVVIFPCIGLIKALLYMVGTSNLGSWNGHWFDPPIAPWSYIMSCWPCYQVFPIVVHATTASSATPSAFGCDPWLPRKAAADASGPRWRRRWPGKKKKRRPVWW